MLKKIKKFDILFIIALIFGLAFHIYFVFSAPFFDDESFYVTIPFRLINGDSLIQEEWHLSQFSSLFSYLPVLIWTTIKGSAEGIFVFLRFVYLFIHTALAVFIYGFFRKYNQWAVITAILFYSQTAYRTLGISYQSMFVMFLLLMTLCLVSIYQEKSVRHYIPAGICFGCCCVCNPLFCFAFIPYLIVCILFSKQESLTEKIVEFKLSKKTKKDKKLTNKEKKEMKQQLSETVPDFGKYDFFFGKNAFLRFFCGILITIVIAVVFFLVTGGRIDSVFENLENLLGSSEYDIASDSVFSKLSETVDCFQQASLGMGWMIPVVFVVMFFDKKRVVNSHRLAYLFVCVVWIILYTLSTTVIYKDMYLNAVSLPLCLMATVCYCLTEKKNKALFYCMYIPSLIGTFFQYMAANTHLAVIGVVLAVADVAGVFFVMDLWKEMRVVKENTSETTSKKACVSLCNMMIVAGLCLQLLIYGSYYARDRIYASGDNLLTTGPYAGVYMSDEDYNTYSKQIIDMDEIRSRTMEKDDVYLASYHNWMYMHLDRSAATYTTWYVGSINPDQLTKYYKENPDKIPKYIYVESSDPSQARTQMASEMFYFSSEELSNGLLLTIEGRKF